MTKAEELKLLEKIEELLRTSDANSYIASTFAGVSEVCRNNIINDFGDEPVRDLGELRERFDAELRMHEDTKRMLAEAQNMCAKVMDERDELRVKLKDSAKLLRLEHENQALQTHLDEATEELTMWKNKWSETEEALRKEKEASDQFERYLYGEQELGQEKDVEIMRLKAEIYDLRKECGK